MTFLFKQTSFDFYVSENLPFELSGRGDALYVYIEKRNITTHEIITFLHSRFGLSRKSIGIAGLKDKKAIAKQRISIYDRALQKIGGERVFLEGLAEKVRILEVGRHAFPLNLSTPITNSFHIKLKATKKFAQEEKKQAKAIVEELLQKGYPNYFGDQRFGINGRNATQGREIMSRKSNEKFTKSDKIFKLQAFASNIFNEYAKKRTKNNKVLDGDIITWIEEGNVHYGIYAAVDKTVQPCAIKDQNKELFFVPQSLGTHMPYDEKTMIVTGPVPGFNTPLPPAHSVVGILERSFLEERHMTHTYMHIYKELLVYGLRRALRVHPTTTKVHYIQDDMVIDFTLPSGAYASVLVDLLMQAVTKQEHYD